MGYLITAHVLRDAADFSRLAELPKSIGYRVFLHRTARIYLLDAFRGARTPDYPFQTLMPAADIPLELPPGLDVLERLYSQLGPLANSFKRSYINAALLLNQLLQAPVFSFASNDDELDFTCSASNDALTRLKCRCGDLLVSFQGTTLEIAPLTPEAEADEEFVSDVESLKAALPEAEILPRHTPWNSDLHAIAIEELRAFAGIDDSILGLGSFDPPEDESDWELIASR